MNKLGTRRRAAVSGIAAGCLLGMAWLAPGGRAAPGAAQEAAKGAAAQIAVVSPPYCSDVQGNTRVTVAAPGFESVTVKCWKQGTGFGADSTVATVALDAQGGGSFVFPADGYPHGPVTLTISRRQRHAARQLLPPALQPGRRPLERRDAQRPPPPAAKGMTLVFADDFTGPLSISGTDPKATYYDHKPPNGCQDFSTLPFTSHDAPEQPVRPGRTPTCGSGRARKRTAPA